MKRTLLTAVNLLLFVFAFGQCGYEKEATKIFNEGKKLYLSEKASWNGTDLFFEKYTGSKDEIGGYFSYSEDKIVKCIFFNRALEPKAVWGISFDSTFSIGAATIDSIERPLTKNESDLFAIRQKTISEINTDRNLFKMYENMGFNIIPLIEDGVKKVYVLTASKKSGEIVFGNDFLLTFDVKNNLIKKKKLHNNIIVLPYSDDTKNAVTSHIHLKETGDFITVTDVCTLLLYGKTSKWQQHIVMSKKFVCLWDCERESLVIWTRKFMDKLYKNLEKNKEKNQKIMDDANAKRKLKNG